MNNKTKKVFMGIAVVLMHILLNASIVPVGALISQVLYELVGNWSITGHWEFGMWMLVPQATWILWKLTRKIEMKNDNLYDDEV